MVKFSCTVPLSGVVHDRVVHTCTTPNDVIKVMSCIMLGLKYGKLVCIYDTKALTKQDLYNCITHLRHCGECNMKIYMHEPSGECNMRVFKCI